jgi:hypothetical protein
VVIAGKSMGGRVGSHLVGENDWSAHALVYYGYPLVPLGKGTPRDTSHLNRISARQLFFAGARDRLSPPDSVLPLAETLPAATVELIEGGDHSFKVPKATGRTHEEVISDLASLTVRWLQ